MSIEDEIQDELAKSAEDIRVKFISPQDIVFEERVSLLCFHCKNYNVKFTCPPRIPKINYKNIITQEYQKAALVYVKMGFDEDEFSEIRGSSTVVVQKKLLDLEKLLFKAGVSTPLSLIGGSCKLCKSGCPEDRCNNPHLARIPMEAAGINVVLTVNKFGINDVKFPVVDYLYRFGLLLW